MSSVSIFVSSGTVSVPTEAAAVIVSADAAISVAMFPSSVIDPTAASVTFPVNASRLAASSMLSPALISITLPPFAATWTVSLTVTVPPLDLNSTVEPALATTAALIPPRPSSTVRSPTAVMLTLPTLAAPTS